MYFLKFKSFSPVTEVIEWEQVIKIDVTDKPIMLNHGQIMLSKVPDTNNIL